MTMIRTAAAAAMLLACLGCISHHIEAEPLEVKPIFVTVDVNVKVQRELNEFFDFERQVDPDQVRPQGAPEPRQDKKE